MKYPSISIVVATYNSEKTLAATLESIRKQNYPLEKVEILAVDGGSTDQTLKIAAKYRCRIISNPKTELIYAKYLGFYRSTGKYLIFLDSDEVLQNKQSLQIKVRSMTKNPHIRAVMLGGYKTPHNSSQINNYINEFGDPFSFFVYRESKGDDYLIPEFTKRFSRTLLYEDKDCIVIDFQFVRPLPLIELWAGGSMVDAEYIKKTFPEIKKNPGLLAHLFYLINQNGGLLALSKNDFTIHDSVPNLSKYFKKLASRVKNNIFKTDMGVGGYIGRDKYQSSVYSLRRYVFIIYACSLIWPIIDGIYLAVSRRNKIYFLHPVLTWYTFWLIGYFYLIKSLKIKIDLGHYGR
jgi:glycosyltransferase involved in cell wall biosynthesis